MSQKTKGWKKAWAHLTINLYPTWVICSLNPTTLGSVGLDILILRGGYFDMGSLNFKLPLLAVTLDSSKDQQAWKGTIQQKKRLLLDNGGRKEYL